MQIIDIVTVFDAADIDTESAFWTALTEGTVEKETDWHSIRTADGRRLAVQLAPDHTPPEWPDGSPQQMHVEQFRVYADPAGHPFCLCWH
ncbi:MAG: hypothetical protein MUE31_05685 [Candidatus Nanopelagicales bacterium]|nr:hypothetical protein [Candidatus Nanopelagicales bacterium]